MMVWGLVALPVAAAIIAGRLARGALIASLGGLGLTAALGLWASASEAASILSWGPRFALTAGVTDIGRLMVVLVPVIALPIVVYSNGMEAAGRVRLISLLTAFVGAMELLVIANDLLTLLIGWELVGAFSWVLIGHNWREVGNVQRASHAFITTRLGDLGLYVAAGLVFASTGSFAYTGIAEVTGVPLQVIAAGVVVAAAAKSAQIPFSPWLFSAMAGPTPVSALLHSSTMVAAGAYLLVRLAPQLDPVGWFGPALIAIGLTSALTGGLIAAVHRHPKRLLAASTTAQYGLMFAAVGAGSALAAGTHLVTHATFKSLLFLSAGVAIASTGSEDLAAMRPGSRVPVVAAGTGIGVLALGALPPLGGAWTKEQIAASGFEFSPVVGALVVIAGVLSAFYAVRYWLLAFAAGSREPRQRIARTSLVSIGSLAGLSVALGAMWVPWLNEMVGRWVGGEVAATPAWEILLALAAAGVGAGSAILLQRNARLADGLLPRHAALVASEWLGIAGAARRLIVDPVLTSSHALARFDDRVIDAGVRASAGIASSFSRLIHRRWEPSFDGIVNGVGRVTLALAAGAKGSDDHAVDRTVEGIGAGVGWTGQAARKLQTGLSHHYYVIVSIGVVGLIIALSVGAS